MKILVEYFLDHYMGDIAGLFITTPEDIERIRGQRLCIRRGHRLYFGEVLGKHSQISDDGTEGKFTIKSEDQELICKLEELFGTTISGFNPFSVWRCPECDWDAGEHSEDCKEYDG